MRADGFGRAKHQVAGRLERVMEHAHQFFLDRLSEVNQHVAANNQVEFGKWRIARQILTREYTQVTNLLVDAVTAVGARKKSPKAFRRNIIGDVDGVNPRACLFNGNLADVGGED